MRELTHLISSTPLSSAVPAQSVTCARTTLGRSCLRGTGYECLCDLAAQSTASLTRDKVGTPAFLTLTLTVGQGTAQSVMAALDLTGLVAGYEASRQAVTAVYNLSKPQNAGLREHIGAVAN